MRNHFLPSLAMAVFGLIAIRPAHAAESYDNCTGFIDTLPATISTQGTWCLRKDLSTAMTSGAAITVNSNNVTIDCNDYKLGGLAAGMLSDTSGIRSDKLNVTVRQCRARGFRIGIDLTGAYALVEHNRLDLNTFTGIRSTGESSVIRSNTVLDTGGRAAAAARGIDVAGPVDVIGNIIGGVTSDPANNLSAWGILLSGGELSGSAISGNHVRGLVPGGSGTRRGISALSSGVSIRDNVVGLDGGVSADVGVACATSVVATGNSVVAVGSAVAYAVACIDGGGNASG